MCLLNGYQPPDATDNPSNGSARVTNDAPSTRVVHASGIKKNSSDCSAGSSSFLVVAHNSCELGTGGDSHTIDKNCWLRKRKGVTEFVGLWPEIDPIILPTCLPTRLERNQRITFRQ